MRQGQNRRMRGRNTNNRKGPNPLQRGYESNGPDVKVRGNAQHIAEKYVQLARDAQSSGDRVMAENYLQHAEHYFRLVLAAQEQLTQQYGTTFSPQRFGEDGDDGDEDGDEDSQQAYPFGVAQPSQNGGDGENGFAQQGYENQPRQESRQERSNQERSNQDRGNQSDRSEGRFDRNNNQRFDRNGNRDRNNNRNDRNDRGPRTFERDSQPDDQPRQDRGGAERFDRNNPPRHQESRNDNRHSQPRGGEMETGEAGEQPRLDRDTRPPRSERGPRQERSRPRYGEDEGSAAEGLPAFLTNPVRVPPAAEAESRPAPAMSTAVAPVPAKAAEETGFQDAPQPDTGPAEAAAPKKPRGRPRRSPREVMDALSVEPTSE